MSIIPSYGSTAQALTVTNLQGLADDAFWNSSGIQNTSTSGVWIVIQPTLISGVAAGSSNGFGDVFLAGSIDQTNFAGGVNSTEGTFSGDPSSSEQAGNMRFLGRITMPSEDTVSKTFVKDFSLPSFTVPKDFVIVIQNGSGAALSTSGNTVSILKNQISTG